MTNMPALPLPRSGFGRNVLRGPCLKIRSLWSIPLLFVCLWQRLAQMSVIATGILFALSPRSQAERQLANAGKLLHHVKGSKSWAITGKMIGVSPVDQGMNYALSQDSTVLRPFTLNSLFVS